MRNLLTRLSAPVALVLLLAGGVSAQVISVDPEHFDFGDMKQNETRTTTVTITNNGGGMLVIKDVKADCGCTVPSLTTDQLGPGESTVMEIEFNSKTFIHKVYKKVTITSNDPLRPVVDVALAADISSPLIVDPINKRIGFERSPAGQSFTKFVTFTATEIPELEIKVGDTHKGLFEVSTEHKMEGDARVARLAVTLPSDLPAGRQRDNVRVQTNVPEFPTVDIDIRGWVLPPLTILPEAVNFRFKQKLVTSVMVKPRDKGQEFKVTDVTIDMPEISVRFEEIAPNKETRIYLEGAPVPADDPRAQQTRGRMAGTLVIHTDLAELPRIEVPVTYMIRM